MDEVEQLEMLEQIKKLEQIKEIKWELIMVLAEFSAQLRHDANNLPDASGQFSFYSMKETMAKRAQDVDFMRSIVEKI